MLAGEARGGILDATLEQLVEVGPSTVGAAYVIGDDGARRVAERLEPPRGGRGETSDRLALQAVLDALASRAAASRRVIHAEGDAITPDEPLRAALATRGIGAAVAAPAAHHRDALAVFVLLAEPGAFDPSALEFYETAANFVALAVERERTFEREALIREQLVEAGRLASLGLLTATVAHELRNPLSVLVIHTSEQSRLVDELRLASDEEPFRRIAAELGELAQDSQAALSRIRETVSQLSMTSRKQPAPENLELADVAREALALARTTLRSRGIPLEEEHAEPVRVRGRRDNLVQVVLNLVFNAADACEASGRAPARVTVRTGLDAGRAVLVVDDTGQGVPPELLRKIFEPFFTTKGRGRGTGLGLKICSDVVAAHHGHIEVANRPEGGASFRVVLPRVASAETPIAGIRAVPTAAPPPRSRKVLVVDDDEMFARSMRRSLRPHDVRIATTAAEASAALLDPSYVPELVLCDVGLPDETGDLVHARVRAARPEIASRFVFVTGGVHSAAEAERLRASGCVTLTKPVDPAEVLAVLAAPGSAADVTATVATLRPAFASDPNDAR